MAKSKKKSKSRKRSEFARFIKNQRRACPTMSQVRRSYKFYKKWKQQALKDQPERVSKKQLEAIEKAAVAKAYQESLRGGQHKETRTASFFPSWASADPGRRKKKAKKGRKSKPKARKTKRRGAKRKVTKGLKNWHRLQRVLKGRKVSKTKRKTLWNKWKKKKFKGNPPKRDPAAAMLALGDRGRKKKRGTKRRSKGRRVMSKGLKNWSRFAKAHKIRPFKKAGSKKKAIWNKWKKRKFKGKVPMRDARYGSFR
jgi:hypothetical protein